MVTIQNAQVYTTTAGELAYQIDYSTGTSVRAVESRDRIIRNEYKTPAGWKQAGVAYKVVSNKMRQAERVKADVIKFCAA